MANTEHLNALLQGVQHWNQWRYQPDQNGVIPGNLDLSGADLTSQNLADADLRDVNFTDADLRRATLDNANLSGADFTGATLTDATFATANLTRTDFSDATLENVDLSTTIGLLIVSLAGADLTRAKLHESISKFENLGRIDELSKNTGALFVSMLAACAYSWLTIGSTRDLELVLNSGASKLPIIQTEIPIVAFYYVGPFVLLGIFLYFHLYLQRLWEALTRLPAIFPDSLTIDRKTYAWLLNDLIRAYLPQLKKRDEPLLWLQKCLSLFLAYFLVPLTLWLFWARYLVRHEWIGTSLQIIALSVGFGSSIAFYQLAKITMRKDKVRLKKWMMPLHHPGRVLYQSILVVVVGFLAWHVSRTAIESPNWMSIDENLRTYALLTQKDISKKPEKWAGKDDEYQWVKGAELEYFDFAGARLGHAFLAKSNLHGADFRGAFLYDADLTYANLIYSPS